MRSDNRFLESESHIDATMATTKRGAAQMSDSDQDPDYVMVTSPHPPKKQKIHQQDAKDTTVKKIEGIIKKHFSLEIKNKEKEIELADERIHQVRQMLDKLRACVVANYYGNAGVYPGTEKGKQKMDLNHPAIQRALGTGDDSKEGTEPKEGLLSEIGRRKSTEEAPPGQAITEPKNGDRISQPSSVPGQGSSRFHVKKRIIVGNVSKYITADNREESDPSTHKWMVYVRGPPEEPRIDHFVKKVWFYLHPSYRPNDLVEVKDPPYHLTRRGWGEFPIRVQLHFTDPRSKKVDIIHHLKLDRTYTGLQTLGAETIVDVELDRYLFDDGVTTGSRPSTPTVTEINYREGYKAGLSRTPPSLRSSPSIFSTKSSTSPLNSEDQNSTPASSPVPTNRGTPVSLVEDDHASSSRPSTPSPSLTNKVQIQSGMIVSSTRKSPEQTDGKFIHVLPSSSSFSSTPAPTKGTRPLSEMPKLSLSSSLTASLTSGLTSNLASGVRKVADAKGALSWRIEEGKLLEITQGKVDPSIKTTLTLPPPLQATPSSSTTLAKPRAKLPSLKAIGQSAAKPIATSNSQMTLLGRQTVKSLLGPQKVQPAGAAGLQVVSATPGAQYYITAKSTDPNLQGKVILIPHQVFAQAQGPGKTAAGKTAVKPPPGKGKSSFLSPSNVLILPQGSIVPPLPPGSIVQIQQVPSPARTAQNPGKPKTMTNLIRTGITSPKGAIPVVSTGGSSKHAKIIQTVGSGKVVAGGVKVAGGGAKGPGVSLLPDIKSQLSRTPSGGVILVQRMPTKPSNTQVGAGVQRLMMTQRQQQSSLGTVSGQAKQSILLQSPTSPPPVAVTSSGKVLLPSSQTTKRVLTEPAQTLPVPEGTVEITRTLTETLTDRRTSFTLPHEVVAPRARNPSTTSYARLPGLSPIKPLSIRPLAHQPTSSLVVNIKPSGIPGAATKASGSPIIVVSTPSIPASTPSVPATSTQGNTSPVTSTLGTTPPVTSKLSDTPLEMSNAPDFTKKPPETSSIVSSTLSTEPPVNTAEPPVTSAAFVEDKTDQGQQGVGETEDKVPEAKEETSSGDASLVASSSTQLVTVNDVEVSEKVVIKSEPKDDDNGSPPRIVPTSTVLSTGVVPTLASTVLSAISRGLVVASSKGSQDEVLKVAVEPIVRKETPMEVSISPAGILKPPDPTINRLADPTSRVIITKVSTSLPVGPAGDAPRVPPSTIVPQGELPSSGGELPSSGGEPPLLDTQLVSAVGSGDTESSTVSQISPLVLPSSERSKSLSSVEQGTLSPTGLKSQSGLAMQVSDADREGLAEETKPTLASSTQVNPPAVSAGEMRSNQDGLAEEPANETPTEQSIQEGTSPTFVPKVDSSRTEPVSQVDSLLTQATVYPKAIVAESKLQEDSSTALSTQTVESSETSSSAIGELPEEQSTLPHLVSQVGLPSVDPVSGVGSITSKVSSPLPLLQGVRIAENVASSESVKSQGISSDLTPLVRRIKKEPMTGSVDAIVQQPSTSRVKSPPLARTYLDQPALLRWCTKLNLKKSEHISLYGVKTMEELIRRVVEARPLYREDRNIEELPYGATSLYQFQSWPVGKRRAAEWQRALNVRRMAYRQIHRIMALWHEKVWTTKRIMKWCRRRGYSPGDIDLCHDQAVLCNICGLAYHVKPTELHTCETQWLSNGGILREPTYSIPDDWCQTLKDVQASKEKDLEEVVIIDVVTASPSNKIVPKMEIKEEEGLAPKIFVPPSPGAACVSEEANEIGIHFKSSEVAERIFAPVVEEMLLSATRQFLTDLLRLSHEQAYNSQPKQRIPAEIHPVHIHQAIRSTDTMDFLTNHKLGVLNEIPGADEETG